MTTPPGPPADGSTPPDGTPPAAPPAAIPPAAIPPSVPPATAPPADETQPLAPAAAVPEDAPAGTPPAAAPAAAYTWPPAPAPAPGGNSWWRAKLSLTPLVAALVAVGLLVIGTGVGALIGRHTGDRFGNASFDRHRPGFGYGPGGQRQGQPGQGGEQGQQRQGQQPGQGGPGGLPGQLGQQQQGQQQQGQQQQGQQGGPGTQSAPARGLVSGTIQSVNGNTVTVKTVQGTTVKVTLSGQTQVRLATTGSASSLKAGQAILAVGLPQNDGSVAARSVQSGDALRGLFRGPVAGPATS